MAIRSTRNNSDGSFTAFLSDGSKVSYGVPTNSAYSGPGWNWVEFESGQILVVKMSIGQIETTLENHGSNLSIWKQWAMHTSNNRWNIFDR